MRKLLIIIAFAVTLHAMALHAVAQPRYCGVERTPVKTLADHGAVDFDDIILTHVSTLRAMKAPKWRNSAPRNQSETHFYEMRVWIIGYKFEDGPKGDGDYHVVISTPGKRAETMILEIPDPGCGRPEYADRFQQMRDFIASLGAKPGPKFYTLKTPVPVTVAGVLFFDKVHGQKGVAPNGVEIHPGLEIRK